MRLLNLLLTVLAVLSSCSMTPKGDAWTDLNEASAWRAYKGEWVPAPRVFWNQAIYLAEGGAGDLITVERFGAFEFEYEWRISPGGNSGIMFHIQESNGPTYVTGPEMQVLDNVVFDGERSKLTSAGACYALYGTDSDASRPAGAWNKARLSVQANSQTKLWLSGALPCAFQLGSDDWNKRVGESKFGSMPGFGLVREGHLALQDHGNPVWYRALRIRRL